MKFLLKISPLKEIHEVEGEKVTQFGHYSI
jgi:hypothetical protein